MLGKGRVRARFIFNRDYYEADLPGGNDPKGPVAGSARVIRGGGWDHDASYCRSAYRSFFDPAYRCNYFGFRVARLSE